MALLLSAQLIADGQVHTADLADGQIDAGKLHADTLDRTWCTGIYDGTNHYTFTGETLDRGGNLVQIVNVVRHTDFVNW